MVILAIIFTILIALHLSSCHPPTRHLPRPVSESTRTNDSLTSPDCVTVAHQGTYPILHTRMKRSRSSEVSLSPQSAPPSYTKPDNGTETNTTLSIEQHPQSTYSRIPFLENIITPIFRTVILLLTLFNVNITWRIHGQCLALPTHSLDMSQSSLLHSAPCRTPSRETSKPTCCTWLAGIKDLQACFLSPVIHIFQKFV